MTQQQPYEVVRSYDTFELRRYPSHLIAEVVAQGSFEGAGNAAFRPLFGYINGQNSSRESISMTAPVVQRPQSAAGQKVAMTAPVLLSSNGDQYAVGFVLPSSLTEATVPTPTNPDVAVRVIPSSLAAVVRYSGRWSQSSYDRHLEELLEAVGVAGLTPVGPPRFARFDPPFKPWFLRRNEIVIDVQDSRLA